ncbi:MAG TPA: CoA transferase [Trueperaceae bacterium]
MLDGIKVLDLSRVLAGPYCTQLLADLGATVWKVEPPGGDETRSWGPPYAQGESAYYLSVNRNKQGLSVNLKDPRGAELVARLADAADVLVENLKTGDSARYGLDYPTISRRNQRIVYASITGYGQTGPRAHEPGYDAAIQAASGLMAMTGEPGGGPVKLGVAWVDVLAGVHAATAITAALFERGRTGRGRYLDIALLDVAMAAMVNQAQSSLLTGEAPRRLGSAHPSIVPYQAFATADGELTLAVGNDRQFRRLCELIGQPELAIDERFAANSARVENRDELLPRISAALLERPRGEWLAAFGRAGIPAAPVNSLPEALSDVQVRARGMVAPVPHPLAGEIPMVMSPFARGDADRAAPPLLAQHNREVLSAELGLTDAELDELESAGVLTRFGPVP